MLLPSIKHLNGFLGLLLFLAPCSSVAQSEKDTTFNGIDYYAGRIVRGFGGGFEQQVGDKEQGIRTFRTLPFIYSNVGDRIGLQLSNATIWQKFDDAVPLPWSIDKSTYQITRAQAAYRATAGSRIDGGGAFRSDKSEGPGVAEHKFTSEDYSLRALCLSRGGRIELTPEQLAYAYYGEPDNWTLQNISDRELRFLSPGQSMLYLSGAAGRRRLSFHRTVLVPGISHDKSSAFETYRYLYADFFHAVDRRVGFGFSLNPSYTKNRADLSGPDYEWHELAKSTSIALTSRLDYLSTRELLHRLGGEYSFGDSDISTDAGETASQAAVESKGRHWGLHYTLHYLGRVDPPSTEAFLADQNGVFGNRLPANALHVITRASTSFSKSRDRDLSPATPGRVTGESELHSYEFSMTCIYGIGNWFEVGANIDHGRSSIRDTQLHTVPPPSAQALSVWRSSLVFGFANFRYEARFRDRFGWEQLPEFDRFYNPLLRDGMMRGLVAVQYSYNSNKFEDNSRHRFTYWSADAYIRYGMKSNMELSLSGRILTSSSLLSDGPTQKTLEASITWQPWQTIRFELARGLPNRTVEILLVPALTEVWSLRMVSLF